MFVKNPQLNSGFTLLELMITVGVIAIIAGIAIPSYNGYQRSARLSECAAEVSVIKLAEEEYFLENNTYFIGANIGALETNSSFIYKTSFPAPVSSANCTIAVTSASATTTYTITATGQNRLDSTDVISKTY